MVGARFFTDGEGDYIRAGEIRPYNPGDTRLDLGTSV